MSREIEFRAWYEYDDEKVMLQIGDDYGTSHPLDCCNYQLEGQPVTLMQYIGRKDKDGSKIFEGDIVITTDNRWNEGEKEMRGVVELSGHKWIGRRKGNKAQNISMKSIDLKVIGNIFANPELMEVAG